MSKLGIIYSKVENYAKMDKFQLFADCVTDKLELHLENYYKRLENKLSRAYAKVLATDDMQALKDANRQLKKTENTKYY